MLISILKIKTIKQLRVIFLMILICLTRMLVLHPFGNLGWYARKCRGQSLFWSNLYTIITEKYHVQSVVAIDKITNFLIKQFTWNVWPRLRATIVEVNLNELPRNIDMFRCNSGYFSEYHAISLSELSKIINIKYQTLAYYGFSKKELNNFIYQIKPSGIDRIVPIGKTMDFSLIWDGYDLITTLSREVEIV